eukprot:TRINITY_DN86272_c0_g1_i1.p1 TRINITY_DN86272_c0_g1~~TRINITY_DN86272_c0_g1_i1.p1  ORF type:complete len:135 (-),score=8.03 TRINITY_DN86272_c0_g1_i1:169-573(-)
MAGDDDPLAYKRQLSFNVANHPSTAHIIETIPTQGEKKVAICRCWTSKKFPLCDGNHKKLQAAGDKVGPFIATLRGKRPSVLTDVSSNLRTHGLKSVTSVAACALLGYALAEAVIGGRELGIRLVARFNSCLSS